MRRAVLGALAVGLALSGCSSADRLRGSTDDPPDRSTAAASSIQPARTGPLARFYDQKLRWRSCRGGFECTRLEVPLDYGAPAGRTITLAVVRLPARDDDPRGSLVLNPGGPGASGVEYARAAESVVSGAVRRRYDVVGFDPRGVARSAPITCLTDTQLDEFLAIDGSPDSTEEELALEQEWKGLGAGCLARRPALTAHVGTREVARDLDVLRAALGDRRLSYLGKSYGTYIGATYADIFPRRVGRLVLDGPLDPSSTGTDIAAGQTVGFERAFRSFLDDCVGRSSCPFSGGVDAAERQVDRLFDAIDAKPLRGEPGRPVTQALAVIGVAAALYDEGSWALLRDALREAKRGSGDTLLALADYYSDRGPDGTYTTNAMEALYAVNCLDRPEQMELADYRAEAVEAERVSPVFGAFIAWGNLPCASWPVPPQGSPHPVAAEGAKPILVVGTTRDPATPYAWAKALASQLDSGRLLTFVGDGHTAYRRGNACIDRAVDRYLLEGRLPAKGTRCR
ncbi:MAG TPA: alpha/beta hydrolase [Actinomycetes bacterium]